MPQTHVPPRSPRLPTLDQIQWQAQLSGTKDGVGHTGSKCGHSAMRSPSPERWCHQGRVLEGYRGLKPDEVHLKRSCNGRREFVEKTLISCDMSCIPRARESIWSLFVSTM